MKSFLNYLLIVLCCFMFQTRGSAQSKSDSISTTWVKYLIVNDSNQLLLRYDNAYKAWELEGVGYEGPITFKSLTDSMAAYLGFTYDSLRLGGLFTYQKPNRYRVTVKPFYVLHFSGYTNGKCFADTARTKWFSLTEAKQLIPFPTMVLVIDQLLKYPKTFWGAAFEEYNYTDLKAVKWRVIEPFYRLAN